MKFKILSDSTCDLSNDLLEKFDISLLPLTVVKGNESFRDSITITPDDIFAHVAAGGDFCSTTAMNASEYAEFFAGYADKYDAVVHINIGSQFSSCYQNACLAAEDFDNVLVIDSGNLTTGQGFVVLKACELAEECNSIEEMKTKLLEFVPKVEASFLLDQLGYMVKGGRCSSVVALGANLLSLKPCIEVKDGKMVVVKKYRGNFSKCLASYIKERLADRVDIDRNTLFVTHTPVTDECKQAVNDALAAYADFDNIHWTTAGCTVSCHCGPGTLGVIFVRK